MLVKETTALSNDILFWGRVQKFNRSTAGHRDMHVCIDPHHRMIHPWHLLKDVHHSPVEMCMCMLIHTRDPPMALAENCSPLPSANVPGPVAHRNS